MKVISVRTAKSKLGRVIDQVIKSREPIVIPRGAHHVMIAPYYLPALDEMELARIGKELDKANPHLEEDAKLTDSIQREIRKYRAEKRRRR